MTTVAPPGIETPEDFPALEWKALPGREMSSPLTGVIDHDDTEGTITALVAISGVGDDVGDVIVPGSLEQAIKRLKPKGVLDHNWANKVSKMVWAVELMPGDSRLPTATPQGDPWPANAGGLLVKAKYNLNKQLSRDAYEDAKFYGAEECFSIGYKVRPGGAKMRGGKRHLINYDVYEWSQVLHGAHRLAHLTGVKSLSGDPDETWYADTRSGVADEGITLLDDGVEIKGIRIVRNAEFWGLPYGTPIKAGMKPRGRAQAATPEEIARTTAPQPATGQVASQIAAARPPGAPSALSQAAAKPGQSEGKPGDDTAPDAVAVLPGSGVEPALAALRERYQAFAARATGPDGVHDTNAMAMLARFAHAGADVRASGKGELAAVVGPQGWTVIDTLNASMLPAISGDIPPETVDRILQELADSGIPWGDLDARRKRWKNAKQKKTDQQAVTAILAGATPFGEPAPDLAQARRDAEDAIDDRDRDALADALTSMGLPAEQDPHQVAGNLLAIPPETVAKRLDAITAGRATGASSPPPGTATVRDTTAPGPATDEPKPFAPTGNVNAEYITTLSDDDLDAEHAHAVARHQRARDNNLPRTSLQYTDSRTAAQIYSDEKRKRAAAGEAPAKPATAEAPKAPPAAPSGSSDEPVAPDVADLAPATAVDPLRPTPGQLDYGRIQRQGTAAQRDDNLRRLTGVELDAVARKAGKRGTLADSIHWEKVRRQDTPEVLRKKAERLENPGAHRVDATPRAGELREARQLRERADDYERRDAAGIGRHNFTALPFGGQPNKTATGGFLQTAMVEQSPEGRREWLAELGVDQVESLLEPAFLSGDTVYRDQVIDRLAEIDPQRATGPRRAAVEQDRIAAAPPPDAVSVPDDVVAAAERVRADAFGIEDGPDGDITVTEEVAARQDRIIALLADGDGDDSVAGYSDADLQGTRRDLVNELALQNELRRRDAERKREVAAARAARGTPEATQTVDTTDSDGGTDTVEDPGPKLRPGVAGAAEDLGDLLNATPRDAEAVRVAADRLARLLRRVPADSNAFNDVHKAIGGDGNIHDAIDTGRLRAGILFTAAATLREERRVKRNTQARARRAVRRLDRERLRAMLGHVDGHLRRRGFDPDDFGGAVAAESPGPAPSTTAPPPSPPDETMGDGAAGAPPQGSASTAAPPPSVDDWDVPAGGVRATPPTPVIKVRKAVLVAAARNYAARYGGPNSPTPGAENAARYIVEGHIKDATQHEWDWLAYYIKAHPELLRQRPATDTEIADHARSESLEFSAEIRADYDRGEYTRALSALDMAEALYPGKQPWDRIRAAIVKARDTNATPARDTLAEEDAAARRAAVVEREPIATRQHHRGGPTVWDEIRNDNGRGRTEALSTASDEDLDEAVRLAAREATDETTGVDASRPGRRRARERAERAIRTEQQRRAQSAQEEGGDDGRPSTASGTALPDVPAADLPGDQRPGDVLPGIGGTGSGTDPAIDRPAGRTGPDRGDLPGQTGPDNGGAARGDGEGDARVPAAGPATSGDDRNRRVPVAGTGDARGSDTDRSGDGVQRRDDGAARSAAFGGPSDDAGPATAPSDGVDRSVTTGERDAHAGADDVPEGTPELPVEQPDVDTGQVDAIPDTGARFIPTGPDDFAPAGKKAKLAANLAALRVLRQLQEQRREATPEEQTALARWAGWGDLPEVFDDDKPEYASDREALRGLLSESEWNEARRNTLNAHYTDASVVQALWAAVRDLGFDGGRVLEPGSGSGTFIGFSPSDADMVGVELDSTTAAISRALYPDSTIRNESFADTRLPAGSFDATIGNVPFGDFALHDRVHNPGRRYSIHNHFIAKSLALTKPGGLCTVLTSRYTLDSQGQAARKRLAELGDLIGAVRLPTGSHSKTSGTDVIEDILIFRRREPGAEPLTPQDWVSATKRDIDGQSISVNDYFTAHPEQVLGEVTAEPGQFGSGSLIVKGDKTMTDLPAALGRITEAARAKGITASPRMENLDELATGDVDDRHDGHIAVDLDGNFTQAIEGSAVAFKVPEKQAAELRALIGLRDTLRALLSAETVSVSNSPEIRALRADLNTQYDDYVALYGPINRYKLSANGARNTPGQGGFRRDPMSAIVRALAVYDPETGTESKTAIFRKRAVSPREIPTTAETPEDALTLCLDTFGEVRLDEIAKMLGTDAPDARQRCAGLIFEQPPLTVAEQNAAFKAHVEEASGGGPDVPSRFAGGLHNFGAAAPDTTALDTVGESVRAAGRLEPAAAYLSGNVRRKLAAAREAAKHDERFNANVAALEAVIPADLGVDEIDGRLGAAWIGADDVRQFLIDLVYDGKDRYSSVKVSSSGGGIWTVEGATHGNKATEEWGTDRMSAGEIVQALLEQKAITVKDTIDKKQYTNLEDTVAAQAKAEEISERFSEWLWEDSARTKRLLAAYNNQFNAIRLRSYDDVGRTFPGMADTFRPFDHQVAAVNRIVSEPCALLAHVVGAGKAQPMDAPILTPTGFRCMGDLMVGDEVISADGTATKIVGVYPQGPKDNYRVTFTDGVLVECNDEHLWRVTSKDWALKGIDPKVLNLAEIVARGLLDSKGTPRWEIPIAEAADFDCGLPRPIDPYLLGVLIGDGNLTSGSVRFTSADEEIIQAVRDSIPAGYSVEFAGSAARPYDYRVTRGLGVTRGGSELIAWLYDLGVMGMPARHKHLPLAYREAPRAVRLALLQGLMDTDGTHNGRGGDSAVFTTVSPRLAEDVAWLVRSLGGVSTPRPKVVDGYTSYNLTLSLPPGIMPFRLVRKVARYRGRTMRVIRKIASVERLGVKPMQCIAVEHASHLYVTSGFAVTHNTAEMAMGAAELKRLGLSRKPAIVVPNHMLEQFSREFLEIYPNAKVLAAGSDDLDGGKRREFVARAATGDWDCVILTQGAMKLIPVSRESMSAYIDRELATMRAQLAEVKAASQGDSAQSTTIKKMERAVIKAEEAMKAKLDKNKDAGVSWEQTGIDYVFVDEAHQYSNLRTISNIAGAGADGSGIAQDLHMKIEYLRANNASGRVATFATGTPIRNTVTQAYIMQRFMRPDQLEEAGIFSFDQWAATFGQTIEEMELKPEGTGFRQTTRFAKFRNVPELLRLFHVFADVKMAEDLQLKTPDLATGAVQNVVVSASDELRAYIADLGKRADDVRGNTPQLRKAAGGGGDVEDNMLLISTDGRKAALSMELVGGQHAPGKIEAAADNIAKIWRETKNRPVPKDINDPEGGDDPPPGGMQIVFLDMGTPGGKGLDAYAKLREQCAARGMDPKSIRFMHEARNDREKAEMFAAARNGQVSVLVGSTEKMGVGTNVQRRAVALHHLDAPWRPSDVEQRDGRIMRQGNTNKEVAIFRYVTEHSFDAYMWQTLERKKKFIDQIMRGKLGDIREIEDVGDTALSYAEVKALATGNPLLMEKAKVDVVVGRLGRLDRQHARTQTNLRRDVPAYRANAAEFDRTADTLEEGIAKRTDTAGKAFAFKIGGARITERAEAVAALQVAIQRGIYGDVHGFTKPKEKYLGTFGGHDLMGLTHEYFDKHGRRQHGMALTWEGLPGNIIHLTPQDVEDLGPGLLMTLRNSLDGLESRRDRMRERAQVYRDEADRMADRIGTPFAHADALKKARDESTRLQAAMEAAGVGDTGPATAGPSEALIAARRRTASRAASMGRSQAGPAKETLKRFSNPQAAGKSYASADGALAAMGSGDNLQVFMTADGVDLWPTKALGTGRTRMLGQVDDPQALLDELAALELPWEEGKWALDQRWSSYGHYERPDYTLSYEEREKARKAKEEAREADTAADKAAIWAVWRRHLTSETKSVPASSGVTLGAASTLAADRNRDDPTVETKSDAVISPMDLLRAQRLGVDVKVKSKTRPGEVADAPEQQLESFAELVDQDDHYVTDAGGTLQRMVRCEECGGDVMIPVFGDVTAKACTSCGAMPQASKRRAAANH